MQNEREAVERVEAWLARTENGGCLDLYDPCPDLRTLLASLAEKDARIRGLETEALNAAFSDRLDIDAGGSPLMWKEVAERLEERLREAEARNEDYRVAYVDRHDRAVYAEAALEAAEARVRVLEEAARPFAEAAQEIDPSTPGGVTMWEHPAAMTMEARHFRSLAAALTQDQGHG